MACDPNVPAEAVAGARMEEVAVDLHAMRIDEAPSGATRGGGSAGSIAVRTTGNAGARLQDVLRANGEEHLYAQIKRLSIDVEKEPPLIFGWHNEEVEEFVRTVEIARTQAGGVPLPAEPLGLPAEVTSQTFKEAVLEYARIPGAAGRLDTSCLPCSLCQAGQVACMLATLDADPWIKRIIALEAPAMLPITGVYVPRPRSDTLGSFTPQRPNSLWG